MPRKQRRSQNPYGSMNPYGNNFHRESQEATEGMLDVSKMVVAGAVTIGTIGLMGNILGGLR